MTTLPETNTLKMDVVGIRSFLFGGVKFQGVFGKLSIVLFALCKVRSQKRQDESPSLVFP